MVLSHHLGAKTEPLSSGKHPVLLKAKLLLQLRVAGSLNRHRILAVLVVSLQLFSQRWKGHGTMRSRPSLLRLQKCLSVPGVIPGESMIRACPRGEMSSPH